MAQFTGNINDLFQKAFGVFTDIPVYYVGDSKPEKTTVPMITNKSTGRQLFDRFSFQISQAGLTFDKSATPEEVRAECWSLPDASVVHFQRAKNIVQTILPGRDGTVKELISMGDWEITFTGFIINYKQRTAASTLKPVKQDHSYPREYRKQMNEVFKINQNMRIYSRLVNDLEIFKVVITSLEFPPLEGYDNVQPYRMTCLSDEDIVLDLSAQ